MTVWAVEEIHQEPGQTQARYFVCGHCAVKHYNEDREHRKAPRDVAPPDNAVVEQPDHA